MTNSMPITVKWELLWSTVFIKALFAPCILGVSIRRRNICCVLPLSVRMTDPFLAGNWVCVSSSQVRKCSLNVEVQCPKDTLPCSSFCGLEPATHVLVFALVIFNLPLLSLSWQIFIGEISMYFIKSTRETLIIQEKTILTGECCYLNPLLRRIIRFIGKHPEHCKLSPCLHQNRTKHPNNLHPKIN